MKKPKEKIIFNKEKMTESKPTTQEKVGMAGGIAGFVKEAVDQMTGKGDFEIDPRNPPEETVVDKVKDQIIGAGDYEV